MKFSEQKGIWESRLQSKNPDDCPCLKHDQAMEKKKRSLDLPMNLGSEERGQMRITARKDKGQSFITKAGL